MGKKKTKGRFLRALTQEETYKLHEDTMKRCRPQLEALEKWRQESLRSDFIFSII